MRQMGMVPVTIWLNSTDLARIDKARGGYVKRATFIRAAAESYARDRLAEKQKA